MAKLSLVEDRGDKKGRGRGVFVHNLSDHEVDCASDVLGLISRAQVRVTVELAFTRYSFSSRPMYKNPFYYSQTPPLFGHFPPPPCIAHAITQYRVPL